MTCLAKVHSTTLGRRLQHLTHTFRSWRAARAEDEGLIIANPDPDESSHVRGAACIAQSLQRSQSAKGLSHVVAVHGYVVRGHPYGVIVARPGVTLGLRQYARRSEPRIWSYHAL